MSKTEKQSTSQAVRLDKWLWAARFYKTRSLCKVAINGGKVSYNGAKGKASRTVEVGALVSLKLNWDEKIVKIINISDKRLGAPEAQTLYKETPESIEKRDKRSSENKSFGGQIISNHKPNKKERRDIKQLKKNIISS